MAEMLGSTTNLLYGYNASWLTKETGNNALFSVTEKALKEQPLLNTNKQGIWGFPEISLHDTAESLLDTLFPYHVNNPSDGTIAPNLPSGSLLISDYNRDSAIKQLSDTLGVNLAVKDCGFALVQLRRHDDTSTHAVNQMNVLVHPNPARIPDEFGVTEDFSRAAADLKRVKPRGSAFSPEHITVNDANEYLKFFTTQGTHFVSNITLGDVIFQVYIMPQKRYDRVKKIYKDSRNKLSGPQAVLFRQYTTDSNTGTFGYVKEYGNILSFSQTETLTASIKKGDWEEDTFAKTNSIFALYQDNASITTETLNSEYKEVTSITTELTSLTLFIEHSRKQIWRRVFKGGIIQKYKKAIQPEFVSYYNYDLADDLKQNELPGFLSNIATPHINTYKAGLDFSTLQFIAAKEVKDFTLYSNYVYNTGQKTTEIPGKEVLISAQLVALENKKLITTLKLTDAAFKSFQFSSQQFYGALMIENTKGDNHYTFVDGLRYISNTDGPNGRYYVTVDADVRKAPDCAVLDKLKNNLHFNFAFAEGNLNLIKSNNCKSELKSFFINSFKWITEIIPSESDDEDLLDLRVRALNAAHVEKNDSQGSFVPILPYKDYEAHIQGILNYLDQIDTTIDHYHTSIEFRKLKELNINIAKDLNKNIIDSGKLLSEYINASVSQQKALADYYKAIIKQKQSEQKKQEDSVNNLFSELTEQQSEINTAIKNYKQAIEDWRVTEAIKLGLTLAGDVFAIGGAIVDPIKGIDELAKFAQLVKKIQKLLKILSATYTLFEDTKKGVAKFKEAQKAFEGVGSILTSDLQWDELIINLDAILSKGPDDPDVKSKKTDVMAAFKIYVKRGKAYVTAKANVQKIASEVYNQQRQKNMIQDQIDRLKVLHTNLNPAQIKDLDKSKIDLIGLTGSLSVIRSQMLGLLAKTFVLKDEALQYTYLQQATPISSFDILGIKGALVTQQGNTITAKTELGEYVPTVTTPIPIEIEVPSESLRDGNVYEFNLQPNLKEFFQYVDVRVLAVVAKVDGIKSTDNGEYLVQLAYNGQPFMDRDVNRDMIVFNTISRHRPYLYKVKGNQPKFTDKGETWSADVNPITPFSTWEISLPNTKTNKGIVFEELTTKITLTFVLKARVHDVKKRMLEKSLRLFTAKNASPIKPSISTLLSQMSGKSVLNSWDVVFNMSLSKINNVLKSQYESLKINDQEYGGKISTNTSIKGANIGNIETYILQKFNINYGYPELVFLVNEGSTGKLEMQITSGTVQNGSKYIGEEDDRALLEALAKKAGLPPDAVKKETIGGKEKLVLQYYNDPNPLETKATLQAVIKIGQVKGLINGNQNILSVVLNMGKGTFSAKDIQIDMSDEQKIAFSDAVKAYFVAHPVNFIINSLDLTGITTLADLKPHQFLFKALKTQNGNEMLQLFIQTNKRETFNYSQTYISTDVPDPIPEGSEASLMINSRIFYGSVLKESLQGDWTFQAEQPSDKTKAWEGIFTQASVHGSVDLSSLNHSSSSGSQYSTTVTDYTYTPKGGNPVKWSLDTMKISTGDHGNMRLQYHRKNTFYFVENSRTTHCSMFHCKTSNYSNNQSSDITLDISASLPVKITETGRKQNIQINASNKSVSIDARTSGGGPCGSDDLQSKINKQLKDNVPEQITKKLNISFDSVSVFALKNLLFPSNNYINLQDAYVPGDLLIIGNFEDS